MSEETNKKDRDEIKGIFDEEKEPEEKHLKLKLVVTIVFVMIMIGAGIKGTFFNN